MFSHGAAKRQGEDGRPVEVLGQIGRLFLQAGLDLAQSLDAGSLGDRQFALRFLSQGLVRGRFGDNLLLPFGERLESVAHSGELLDGELLLGFAASLLELILGIFELGQGLFLFLARLFAVVFVEIALRLLHPAPGVFARPGGPLGAQLGQPLELPIQVLADLGLLLRQALELLLALLGIGVALGFPRLFQVLGLAGAGLGQLVLGVLELFHQPGELSLAAILDRVDQVPELFARLLLLRHGPAPSGSFRADRRRRPACRRSLAVRSSGRLRAWPPTPADPLGRPAGHLAHPLLQVLQVPCRPGSGARRDCQARPSAPASQRLQRLADHLGLVRPPRRSASSSARAA